MPQNKESECQELAVLLDAIEELCHDWRWWPDTEVGTEEVIVNTESLLRVVREYDNYCESV